MQCLSQGARGCLIFVSREQLLPDICFVRQVGDQYLSEQVNRCRKFVSEAVVSQYLFQRRVVRLPNTYLRRQAVCDICLRGHFMRVSSSDAMLMSCVDLMLMACYLFWLMVVLAATTMMGSFTAQDVKKSIEVQF